MGGAEEDLMYGIIVFEKWIGSDVYVEKIGEAFGLARETSGTRIALTRQMMRSMISLNLWASLSSQMR